MKIFYFGGQKSGKTKAGIKKALELSKDEKPYYVATYDNSYGDLSMSERINKHIIERKDDFITIEESHDLTKVIKANKTYLIDCVSMWILNNLEEKEEQELAEKLRKDKEEEIRKKAEIETQKIKDEKNKALAETEKLKEEARIKALADEKKLKEEQELNEKMKKEKDKALTEVQKIKDEKDKAEIENKKTKEEKDKALAEIQGIKEEKEKQEVAEKKKKEKEKEKEKALAEKTKKEMEKLNETEISSPEINHITTLDNKDNFENLIIKIDSFKNTMFLKGKNKDGKIVDIKSYVVSTAKTSIKKPQGIGTITSISLNPQWNPTAKTIKAFKDKGINLPSVVPFGDKLNYMGAAKINLSHRVDGQEVYRIHGTLSENTIGTNESAGCIRMKNKEVVELASFLNKFSKNKSLNNISVILE